jgi:hypothetical protein
MSRKNSPSSALSPVKKRKYAGLTGKSDSKVVAVGGWSVSPYNEKTELD